MKETTAEGLLRDWLEWFEESDAYRFTAPVGITRRYLESKDEAPDDEDWEPIYTDYEEERRLEARGLRYE